MTQRWGINLLDFVDVIRNNDQRTNGLINEQREIVAIWKLSWNYAIRLERGN